MISAPPKRRQRINKEIAKALKKIFLDEHKIWTNRMISQQVGISVSKITQVRKNFSQQGCVNLTIHNKKSQNKISSQNRLICRIEQIMQSKMGLLMTIDHITGLLHQQGYKICASSVHRYLHLLKYTYKRIHMIPVLRNCANAIQSRYDYCSKMNKLKNQQVWFLDQTSFNLNMTPNYGWATRGCRANINIQNPIKSNISVTVIATISLLGLVMFHVVSGACKTQHVINHLSAIIGLQKITIVLDNCAIHKSEQLMHYCKNRDLNLMYLPTYSPQLNPIENYFAMIKKQWRLQRSKKMIMTVQQLDRQVQISMNQIQNKKVNLQAYYKKMREYVQKGINKEQF